MSKSDTDTEPIAVTMLRVIVQDNTTGWVVEKLASFEEEDDNIDCADVLRSIVAERNSIPYIISERTKRLNRRERTKRLNRRRIPPVEPHSFRLEP